MLWPAERPRWWVKLVDWISRRQLPTPAEPSFTGLKLPFLAPPEPPEIKQPPAPDVVLEPPIEVLPPEPAWEPVAGQNGVHARVQPPDPFLAGSNGDGPGVLNNDPVPLKPGPRTGEKHDFTYHHLRRDIGNVVEYLLAHFEDLHARNFDGDKELLEWLWGCDFLLQDDGLLSTRLQGGDKYSQIDNPETMADELAEAEWPIDYGFVRLNDNGIELLRLLTVEPQDLRGRRINRVSKRMLACFVGQAGDNGRWRLRISYLGLFGKQWRPLYETNMPKEEIKKRHDTVAELMAMKFAAQYEWHVAFGTIKGGPRILLPTNPTGSLKLFNNRALEPGKNRRDQLRHWVGEHYRDNAEDLAYVCAHLKGHTQFNWKGFDCELFPSQYDLEKNEFFRKQAKEWRAQRKHNRVRVHLKRGK